jgi:hypothetical protein
MTNTEPGSKPEEQSRWEAKLGRKRSSEKMSFKAEYMSTDTTQLNSTGQILNTCWRLVSFMSVKLNSTQLNTTQHNSDSTQLEFLDTYWT